MIKVSLNVIARARKELTLLVGIIFIALVGELLLFNRGVITDRFLGLKEQHYTVGKGVLHRMELKDGTLISQGANPNITFRNIDLPVDRISISCKNAIAQERGRVLFRTAGEDFTWAKSVSYEIGTTANTQIIDLPGVPVVSSLRFDLTHFEKDIVRCKEFVINPLVPFHIRSRRAAVYLIFVLLATFEMIKKLSATQETSQQAVFPSLSFQRLATPLLAVCLVFPDVVFLGASLRITDQVRGGRSNFPLMAFYPHYPHQHWDAGLSDYFGAFFQSEPMMEFMVRSVHEGQSPYWNPYSAAGSLGPETLVDNKFSAFTLVYALLGGGQKTYNFVALSLYFLAAYFTYRLLREKLQLSFLATLAGIFFFLLNGYATANLGSNVAQSYLFVPLCLYASICFLEQPTAWRIAGVVLAFAAFFSYTFLPTSLTSFMGMYAVVLGYALMRQSNTQKKLRSLFQLLAAHAACVFASILLLALIYFPIAENLRSSDTVSLYSNRNFQPTSWVMLPSVFSSSHFFETPRLLDQGVLDYTAQRNKSNRVYQFGTTALTLAICAMSRKRRDFLPLVLVCVIAIIMGFGRVFGVPVISSIISRIPVISFMIGISYWWPVIAIPLIPLVAIGLDNLQKRFVILVLPFLVLSILVGSLIAVGSAFGLHEPNLWYKKWSIGLLLATGLAAAAAIALSTYTARSRLRNYVAAALVLLAFVELTMDSKAMRYAPDDLFTNPPAEIPFIKQNIGLYRTLTIGPEFGVRHELGSAFSIQETTAINQGTLSHYMDYFHHMISLDLSQRLFYNYYPSLRTMQDTPDLNTIDWGAVDLLGIKYVITPTNFTQYRQVFVDHGLLPVLDTETAFVYENPHVLPRAFTIDTSLLPQQEATTLSTNILSNLEPAEITLYRNNEVTIEGTVSTPSLLVLTDNWQANWTASVNGTPTEILRVRGTFRGVSVPTGPYQVRFHYQPRSLNVAILTSGMMILLIVYLLADHKRIDRWFEN